MKISFVLNDVFTAGGGVLTVVLGLAEELGRRHDVQLVSVTRRNDAPVHRLPSNVPVLTLRDLRRSTPPGVDDGREHQPAERGAADGARGGHPDDQLVSYLSSMTADVVVASQPAVSVAVARHAPDRVLKIAQEHRPLRSRGDEERDLARRFYPRLDVLLTLTERQARRYRTFLRRQVPVVAMPNATPRYEGPLSDRRARVVVAAGRLKRSKGFDRLIDAWSLVQPQLPEWTLRIYGEGPLREELAHQIEVAGLAHSVHLMGYTTGLVRHMADASVFALTSRAEGYPMVLLEAMSAGLAVVSMDCPTGPREILTPGHNGLLVPNGDIAALADGLVQVMSSSARRDALGVAAREHARRNDQSAIADRWEQLFVSSLENRVRRG